jgi:hypothetical protein
MDSLNLENRRPPQFAKRIVQQFINQYKHLTTMINKKNKAATKLNDKIPKSIQNNISFNLPQIVVQHASSQAFQLKEEFDNITLQSQLQLKSVIQKSVDLELQIYKKQLEHLHENTIKEIYTYFQHSFQSQHPDNSFDQEVRSTTTTSLAVFDYRTTINFLNAKYSELKYHGMIEQYDMELQDAQAAAKRASAINIEMDTTDSTLVAELVKREISKKVGSMKKEINSLKASLNKCASNKGAVTGAQTLPKRKPKKQKDGEKAPEDKKGKRTVKSESKNRGTKQGKTKRQERN